MGWGSAIIIELKIQVPTKATVQFKVHNKVQVMFRFGFTIRLRFRFGFKFTLRFRFRFVKIFTILFSKMLVMVELSCCWSKWLT